MAKDGGAGARGWGPFGLLTAKHRGNLFPLPRFRLDAFREER